MMPDKAVQAFAKLREELERLQEEDPAIAEELTRALEHIDEVERIALAPGPNVVRTIATARGLLAERLQPPEYCLGCEKAAYMEKRDGFIRDGFRWYCRGCGLEPIPCSALAILRQRCPTVAKWFEECKRAGEVKEGPGAVPAHRWREAFADIEILPIEAVAARFRAAGRSSGPTVKAFMTPAFLENCGSPPVCYVPKDSPERKTLEDCALCGYRPYCRKMSSSEVPDDGR